MVFFRIKVKAGIFCACEPSEYETLLYHIPWKILLTGRLHKCSLDILVLQFKSFEFVSRIYSAKPSFMLHIRIISFYNPGEVFKLGLKRILYLGEFGMKCFCCILGCRLCEYNKMSDSHFFLMNTPKKKLTICNDLSVYSNNHHKSPDRRVGSWFKTVTQRSKARNPG